MMPSNPSVMSRACLLLLSFLIYACSPGEPGGLTFQAQFPDYVDLSSSPVTQSTRGAALRPSGELRPAAYDTSLTIHTVRVSVRQDGRVVKAAEFDADGRAGQLDGLAPGTYEVRVEGLQSGTPMLRGQKPGVLVVSGQMADAGEFLLAPVEPQAPRIATFPYSVTSVPDMRVEGRKEMFTGIAVHRVSLATTAAPEVLATVSEIPYDDARTFAVGLTLQEGDNEFRIYSVNPDGVQSEAAVVQMRLESLPPVFSSLALVNDASDGFLNAAQRLSSLPLVGNLVASRYETVEYALVTHSVACDGAVSYGALVPTADSAAFQDDGLYRVCVRLTGVGGQVVYGASASFVLDTTPPVVHSVILADGVPTVIVSEVALAIDASADAFMMRVTGDTVSGDSGWVSFLPASTVQLNAGYGSKTVWVRLRDQAGNVSAMAGDSVVFDEATLTLAFGASAVSSPTVHAALYAPDADTYDIIGDIDPMVFSAGMAPSTDVTLTPADGLKTVFAVYHGNGSVTAKATIELDTTPPSADKWRLVSAATLHTCAIAGDRTLWCWGWNGLGRLGDGTSIDRHVPTQEFSGASDWRMVDTRHGHTCAVKTDGTLWCWGSNLEGRLGDGTSTQRLVPTQEYTAADNWRSVSAGHDHTCAVKTDGTLWCWGWNNNGRLGDATTSVRGIPTQEYTAATDWQSVSAGYSHTCALKTDGTLWCWGANFDGQLGDNTTTARHVATQEVTAADDWRMVKAGGHFTCGLKTDDTLWCWGRNVNGRLGDNTTTTRHVPTQEISASIDWQTVDAGSAHTCANKTDGTLWCWGSNLNGRLGDNTDTQRLEPTKEYSAGNWQHVGAGDSHTCGVRAEGAILCWGSNGNGRLGDGSTSERWTATDIFSHEIVSPIITDTTLLSLSLRAFDRSGPIDMMLSGDITDGFADTWQPFSDALDVTLTEGDGVKEVRVRFADAIDNRSEWFSHSVTLDTVPPLVLDALDVYTGSYADPVSISGVSFGAEQGLSLVYFGGVSAAVLDWSDTWIAVEVPNIEAGEHAVFVEVDGVVSNSVTFTAIPVITSLSVTSGSGGDVITLQGTNMGAGAEVLIGGDPSQINSASVSEVVFAVSGTAPPGSQDVVVSVNGQDSSASTFQVLPFIQDIVPYDGVVADWVTLYGTNHGEFESQVWFDGLYDGVFVHITEWTSTQIGLEVPDVTAGHYDVTVSAGGEDSNIGYFTVVPDLFDAWYESGVFSVYGSAFGWEAAFVTAEFDGVAGSVVMADQSSLEVIPPASLTAGEVALTVAVDGVSAFFPLWIDVFPEISMVDPAEASIGAEIVIQGSFFGATQGESAVLVGNEVADIVNWSTDEVRILVPQMAEGTYDLTLRVNGYDGLWGPFSVTAVEPSQVAFLTHPSNAEVNEIMSPPVEVAIQDEFGDTVTGATDVVTVAIFDNPAGGTLFGTVNVAAVGGVATFSDLSIDMVGNGYTLVASSGVLAEVVSQPFDILVPQPVPELLELEPRYASSQQQTWHWIRGFEFPDVPDLTVEVLTAYGTVTAASVTTWLSDGMLKFEAPAGIYPGRHQVRVTSLGLGVSSAPLPFEYLGPASAVFEDTAFTQEIMGAMEFVGFEQDGNRFLFVCTDSFAANRLFRVDGTSFIDESGLIPTTVFDCTDAAVLDVNGNGRWDIVMVALSDQNHLWIQQENGSFVEETATALPAESDHSWGVVVADFNGDGLDDFFVTNAAGQGGPAAQRQSKLYLNQGDGTFALGTVPVEDADVGRPAVGDFTGNGYPDVLLPVSAGDSMFWSNDGTGVLVDDSATWMPADTTDYPVAQSADFFNNGLLDVVMGASDAQTVIYRNEGNAFTIVGASDLPTETADTWALAVGDLDGDGWMDIVVGNGYSTNEQNFIWMNNGDGTFRQEFLFNEATPTLGLTLFDVHGDGDLDILVANDEVAPRVLQNIHIDYRDDSLQQTGAPLSRWDAVHGADFFHDPLADFAPSMLIFGGDDAGALDQLYTLRMTDMTWTERCTGSPCVEQKPSPRSRHAVAYDPMAGTLVVFGDHDASDSDVYHYEVTLDTWRAISAAGPSARREFSLTYVPEVGQMVAFGGDEGGLLHDDWWSYDVSGETWTDMTLTFGGTEQPVTRRAHAAVAGEGKVFIFGGRATAGVKSDVWALDVNENLWTELALDCGAQSPTCPGVRAEAAMTYVPGKRWLVVHGGLDATDGNAIGTFAFDLVTNEWTQLCEMGCTTPPGISFAYHVYDPVERALLWWGGTTNGTGAGATNDLWRLMLK